MASSVYLERNLAKLVRLKLIDIGYGSALKGKPFNRRIRVSTKTIQVYSNTHQKVSQSLSLLSNAIKQNILVPDMCALVYLPVVVCRMIVYLGCI